MSSITGANINNNHHNSENINANKKVRTRNINSDLKKETHMDIKII